MRTYSLVAALLGWAFLAMGYISGGNFKSLSETIDYFSYFSMLSNVLAALTLTFAAFPAAEHDQSLTRPFAVTGVAVYMGVTALPFVFQPLWLLHGWQGAADFGFHHVMPILYFLFWLMFVPKGTLASRHALVWPMFPFGYCVYLQLHGPCYVFLDAGKLGFDRVLVNVVLLMIMFLALGESLVLIDRVLGRSRHPEWLSCSSSAASARTDRHLHRSTSLSRKGDAENSARVGILRPPKTTGPLQGVHSQSAPT